MKQMRESFQEWARAATIRALRTFFQAALAAIPTSAVILTEINWLTVLSTAGLSAILSVMTSIATGLPEVEAEG